MFIISVGNNNANNDNSIAYASAHALGNVIFVASASSTNPTFFHNAEVRNGYSSFGVNTVDIAAPGFISISTYLVGYGYYGGTTASSIYILNDIRLPRKS